MGAIRLFLALVVAVDHLRAIILRPSGLDIPEYYKLGMNAGFAVMFFYTISGFLMSLVLARKYEPTGAGTFRFYQSRFIRIFSLYWPMVIVVLAPSPSAWGWFLANSIADKFTNLFILGMDWRLMFADYPEPHWDAALFGLRQAWTLDTELTFYLVAPFLLRSWRLTLAAFALSAVTRASIVSVIGFQETWTYYFLPSTFLFFLLGHGAYSAWTRWKWISDPRVGATLIAVCVSCLLIRNYATWDSLRFWICVICFAAALPAVFRATNHIRSLNAIGELSYPVYLTHLILIVVLADSGYLREIGTALAGRPSVAALAITLTFISCALVVATAAHYLIEKRTAALMRWTIRSARMVLLPKFIDQVEAAPAPR